MLCVNISDTSASNGNFLGFIDNSDEEIKSEIRAILNRPLVDNFLKKVLKTKGEKLNKYYDYFRTLFLKYTIDFNKLDKLADIIINDPFDFREFFFSIDRIYQFYNDNVPNVIKKELLIELSKFTGINEGQPGIGRGEYLLAFFTILDKSKSGDLIGTHTKYKNKKIEVKSTGSRMMGADRRELKLGNESNKELKELTGLVFKSTNTINDKILKEVFNFMKSNVQKVSLIENIIKALINYKNIVIDNNFYELFTIIKTYDEFKSFALALHMFAFMLNEKITLLIFYNVKEGNFLSFEFKNNIKYYYNFVNMYLINNFGWSDSKPAYQFDFK